MDERELRAANKAERPIHVDSATVSAVDMQERRLPCAQHAIDDSGHQRAGVAASACVRMRADRTDLATIADPHPFTGHCHEPIRFADAEVVSEFDRAGAERPRLRKL